MAIECVFFIVMGFLGGLSVSSGLLVLCIRKPGCHCKRGES